ncbi:DNA cytosine methyltransferase [Rugamonas sp. A1-17]|nr:DNA cytosine methyltransferase [Rugamonas sp. A1-17]
MGKKNENIAKRSFAFLSLFSGCGGFDLGFTKAGFTCAGAVDIDKKALLVHERNILGPTYNFDLSHGTLPLGIPAQVDIVLAGSPCQGFSTLGKRDLDDPRNHLLIVGGKAAITLGAKVFVAENVMSVKSGQHRQYWDRLDSTMKEAGYRTKEVVIDSRQMGLAQSRRRIFLIAWRTGADGEIQFPPIGSQTLRAALSGVEGLSNHKPQWLVPDTDEFKIAAAIPPGHKLCNVRNGASAIHTWEIPSVFGQISEDDKKILTEIISLRRRIRVRKSGDADPLPLEYLNKKFGNAAIDRLLSKNYIKKIAKNEMLVDLSYAFNGKYRRPSWDSHSITVDTRFCNPKYYLHPEFHRGFSTREAARLQGFPDDFIFSDHSHDHTLIGNAVAPPVAQYIANFVLENLLKDEK